MVSDEDRAAAVKADRAPLRCIRPATPSDPTRGPDLERLVGLSRRVHSIGSQELALVRRMVSALGYGYPLQPVMVPVGSQLSGLFAMTEVAESVTGAKTLKMPPPPRVAELPVT